ncbi:hypothetical protein [Paractinoplanes brasiliensis]|uniref:VCBS repeat protein n=1 Tax=Paractinoplanes brasiliensis TaxID=52695 RepID=A0A4R6J9R7_9ACTN|nr:hypothetical protein [Actinoplanes brasiliensis]TDO31176.1 hypothetical protein C8E87_6588 [Actinoplanes brasiliensis]GID28508.1 hypothetical protein Abr02nite_34910 [Actinoplanes brasiliensis]
MRVALAAVVAAALLATGGVVAWSLRSPATVARITAAAGGTVTTAEGVSVRFGPGALSADTQVRIVPRPSVEAPDGLDWLAEPVDISLGAGTLRTSATVTLPLLDEAGGGLITVVSRDAHRVWASEGGIVDRDAGTITTTVGHLSIVSAGRAVVTPPEVPGAGAGSHDAPDPDCGTTRSARWTAHVEDGAMKTCVAAGAAERPALMRVVSNTPTGQFARLGGYPQLAVAQPNRASVAETVWHKLAEADRDYTFLPGRGVLDLTLPGAFHTVSFVTRTGSDVTLAEYMVDVMSSAFVPAEVTVAAVRCALALPPEALDGRVSACVSDAFDAVRILPEGVPENQARADRADVRGSVIAAMRGLTGYLASSPATPQQWQVTARRSPVIPGKALNEPGGSIPAAVVATEERLYAAALRDSLTDVLPPSGLTYANTSLSGPRATDAVAALVTVPPLRWPCDETSRDGYVYGLADPNLLTYPARLADLGLPDEDIGIVRQTAGRGKDYRLCIALDGTWTSLVASTPPGEFPSAAATSLAALGTVTCQETPANAFIPPDSVCRSLVRADLDGDSRTDTLLLYQRGDRWTARAVLAAGRTSDLLLPLDRPSVLEASDLDGEPGEEAALQSGSAVHLLSLTPDGLVLISQPFETASSLTRTAGLGCSDVDGDGRPELVAGGATFTRDPRTGAITAASTIETRWTWRGKSLRQGETSRRTLTGPQASTAAGPPYRDITCSWR